MSKVVAQDVEQPSPSHPDSLATPSGHSSLGEYLAKARQERGLSEVAVASKLHLSVRTIQYLEQDRYDQMPGTVFVRGYVKKYVNLLGLNEQDLPPLPDPDPPRELAPKQKMKGNPGHEISSNHAIIQIITWLIVLGLLSLVGLWWQGQLTWEERLEKPLTPDPVVEPDSNKHRQSTYESTSAVAMPILTTPIISASPSRLAQFTPTLQMLPSPISVASDPKLAMLGHTLPPSAALSSPTPTAQIAIKNQVVFNFISSCWVDVRDSKRIFQLRGRVHKGEKRIIEGTPPYSVILGNSAAVEITINGKPFDIQSYSHGGIARFTIDPSSNE